VGELVNCVNELTDAKIERLAREYERYAVAAEMRPGSPRREVLRHEARVEVGLRGFLERGTLQAFADSYEDLGRLEQLPGLTVQRLMADGYGFGAKGD
jgi:L-arabinose isomerase